jgi:hypothetical protein
MQAQASLERDDEVYSDLLFRFIVSSCIELNRLYLMMFDVFFWLLYLPQDVYFDDESAEVVISSLRLGDNQERFILYYLI